jgi:Xaa-Pro aminopeptidase
MTQIASRGATMAVDWEQRIDFPKLRADRLRRARAALHESDLGALLLYDPNNIRYVTSTHIGEWARDKNARFALLCRSGEPLLWDFGSAARHHQLYAPWLPPESFRGGVSPMRGAMPDETGVPDEMAAAIRHELAERGLAGEPVGIDITDMVALHALQRAGLSTTDGSRVMVAARAIKTDEEIALLDHAAAMVDAAYERIFEMLRPGVTERQIVAEAQRLLFFEKLRRKQAGQAEVLVPERVDPGYIRGAYLPSLSACAELHRLAPGLPVRPWPRLFFADGPRGPIYEPESP